MKIIKTSLSALLASFIFTSCSIESGEVQDGAADTADEVAVAEVIPEDPDLDKELQFKIDLIIGNNITGPSKVVSEVKSQEIGRFQEDLAIPMNEAKTYEGTMVSKGLALGALGVDVTYLSVYDRPDLALKYIATINKLNIDLDCGMVIDAAAKDAFDEAKEDGDKMSQLMYDQYFMMEDNLKSNAKLELASHVMVGGVVESFYISSSQLLEADLSEGLISIIYGQKQVVSDLLGIYQTINGNELIIDGLVEIQAALEKPSTAFNKEDLIVLHGVVKIFHNEIAGEEIM
jgi:hypothetical protein|tara:strand:- start:597 stop:1463 length:867 start_codon:yes stop_codon:yes gene_type:complete